MVIGIPRSLFFYYFFPFWSGFFAALDLKYLVSPETTKPIMEAGASLCADEICLPVKIHFGHIHYLLDKVDLIFSPGFGRWGPKSHFCPKLIGLPDLVRLKFERTAVFWHDLDEKNQFVKKPWIKVIEEIAPHVGEEDFANAWEQGRIKQNAFYDFCKKGYTPSAIINNICEGKTPVGREPAATGNWSEKSEHLRRKHPRILVLGHPYMVYDNMAGQDLLKTLTKAGIRIITKEMIPFSEEDKLWPTQEKRVFWTLGQQILSAAYYFADKRLVDGIILHTACLCGPDALIGDLLEKYLSREEEAPALLKLTVDEHTGYAGLQTRVEAFLDLLQWRKEHAAV